MTTESNPFSTNFTSFSRMCFFFFSLSSSMVRSLLPYLYSFDSYWVLCGAKSIEQWARKCSAVTQWKQFHCLSIYLGERREKKNSANKKENERRTENAARIDKGKKQIPFYSQELKPIEMFDSLPNEKMKKKSFVHTEQPISEQREYVTFTVSFHLNANLNGSNAKQ